MHESIETQDAGNIDFYTLTSAAGMEVVITNYGATVVALKVPDRNGKVEDVVLGYDTIEDYDRGQAFLGGTIGRYANRIACGKFTLGETEYLLSRNDGNNTLHGGAKGFHKRLWTADRPVSGSIHKLSLDYLSRDGEEGFPGALSVSVSFTVPRDQNELRIDYSAHPEDKGTIVNLTNHSYFNLSGAESGDILGHILTIQAAQFTPIDVVHIPTGELRSVAGTPFDFRTATAIGERIGHPCEQLELGHGYDHNFVLNHSKPGSLDLAARVYDPSSGRLLDVLTTEPGLQFYSGNFLDGTIQGKGGKGYVHRSAFCLETQHFPDSPNQPNFPSTVVKAAGQYRSTTVYRFSAL
jgi:aldose 1-epimerase